MKTLNSSKLYKTLTTFSFASLFLLAISTSAQAAGVSDSTKVSPEAELKYVGSVNNSPVFQISLDNPEGKDVYLTMKDDNGNIMYSEWVREKNYSKKIRFEDADLSNTKVNVILSAEKFYQTQSFKINKSVRTIEEVAVDRL